MSSKWTGQSWWENFSYVKQIVCAGEGYLINVYD